MAEWRTEWKKKRVLTTAASDSMLNAIFKAPELNGGFSPISPDHLLDLSSVSDALSMHLAKRFACICKCDKVFITLFELGKCLGHLRERAERC